MESPYLIQRAKFIKQEDSTTRKGIDKLLGFDYMGSSEFEWGALPASLKRIRKDIANYSEFQYSFKETPKKVLTVFCKKGQSESVGEILEKLAVNKIHLKERCDLSKYITGNNNYWDNDFWWDIENDWMFWKFNPSFDIEFKKELLSKVETK